MKRLLSDLYLNLLAGVIALSILAISTFSLWMDWQTMWHEAEQSSRNLLMALSREIGNNITLLDLALKGLVEDVADQHLLVPLQLLMEIK